MNGTVWNKQIDRGLIDYLHGIFNIPVRVRKADEDFKVEDYPMIVIQNTMVSKRDAQRYYPFEVEASRDAQAGTILLEKSASPHTLTYQFDICSLKQAELIDLIAQWQLSVSDHFNLPVTDSGGTTRYANCFQSGQGLRREDKLHSGERLFKSTMTYSIWAEVDVSSNADTETVYTVTDIEVQTQTN